MTTDTALQSHKRVMRVLWHDFAWRLTGLVDLIQADVEERVLVGEINPKPSGKAYAMVTVDGVSVGHIVSNGTRAYFVSHL